MEPTVYKHNSPLCSRLYLRITGVTCIDRFLIHSFFSFFRMNIWYMNIHVTQLLPKFILLWFIKNSNRCVINPVSFDLVIRACQLEMTQHFGSDYCNNNSIYQTLSRQSFKERVESLAEWDYVSVRWYEIWSTIICSDLIIEWRVLLFIIFSAVKYQGFIHGTNAISF